MNDDQGPQTRRATNVPGVPCGRTAADRDDLTTVESVHLRVFRPSLLTSGLGDKEGDEDEGRLVNDSRKYEPLFASSHPHGNAQPPC